MPPELEPPEPACESSEPNSDASNLSLPRPAYQIAGTVHVNGELVGAVVIPLKTVPASERLRLRVELSDPQRNVELGGIGLR